MSGHASFSVRPVWRLRGHSPLLAGVMLLLMLSMQIVHPLFHMAAGGHCPDHQHGSASAEHAPAFLKCGHATTSAARSPSLITADSCVVCSALSKITVLQQQIAVWSCTPTGNAHNPCLQDSQLLPRLFPLSRKSRAPPCLASLPV